MKVLFATPSTKFSENFMTNNSIKQAILKNGHELLSLDDLTMQEMLGDREVDIEDWQLLARRQVAATHECDVAIFDATDKASFGVGYMAAIALASSKPTLFLLKKGSLEGAFINGLEHAQLQRSYYEPSTVASIVVNFLKDIEC